MSRDFLSRADYALMRLDMPDNHMIVTALIIFDTPVNIERLKYTLNSTILKLDRFRQRVVTPNFPWQAAYWEEDAGFDLNHHLHTIQTPLPEDATLLQEFASRLMSLGLDYSIPLWQFFLLEHYGTGSALLARLHHSIADGISLVKILLSATQSSPEEDEHIQQTLSTPANKVTIQTNKKAITGFSRDLSKIRDTIQVGNSVLSAAKELLLSTPDKASPFKGKVEVHKRAAWSMPLSLSDVKYIGKTYESTVNDVLLSVLAGSLRRYLIFHDLTSNLDVFHSFVPVDLRRDERRSGVFLGSSLTGEELGNQFGFAILSLPLETEDPVERLSVIHNSMNLLKASGEALVSFWILNLLGMVPGSIQELAARFWLTKGSAVMTNVPGPQEKRYLAGAPIKSMIGWVPQSGDIGLGVSIFSYNNQVLLALNTDQGLIPDPERICGYFFDEYQALWQRTSFALKEEARLPLDTGF